MGWHFPLIRPVQKFDDENLVNKVLSELTEFEKETDLNKKALEAIDVLHSAETLVRKFFLKYPSLSFRKRKRQVIEKNKKRGYYKNKRR